MVSCLEAGVAFHHGAMPRYIQAELVDSFNRGDIDTLVCTTTLTEGVNTTAKNVIVFSDQKGIVALSGFDYKNIKREGWTIFTPLRRPRIYVSSR